MEENKKQSENHIHFMTTKVHIIGGTGQMGGWVKTYLSSHSYKVTISNEKEKNEDGIKSCDILILSVPIEVAPTVTKQVLPLLKKETTIIDLSSLMSLNEKTLKDSTHPSTFIHFLFGPSVGGIQNQHVVINTIKESEALKELIALFSSDGAQLHTLSTKDHDYMMAHIQALTHFSNLVLAHSLESNLHTLIPELTTPTYLNQISVVLRVISNNSPELLANIQLLNPYTQSVLSQHVSTQQDILTLIEKKNLSELTEKYEELKNTVTPQKTKETEERIETSILPIEIKEIAYLGPEGTFSHQAAKQVAENAQLVPSKTIRDIFESVAKKEVAYGIVPAENTTEGTIRETLDYLTKYPVLSLYSHTLSIHQNLLTEETKLEEITTVISHPQGIAQCQEWLKENLSHAELRFAKSTVSDIEIERKTKGTAFICSSLVSEIYDLPILKNEIEDSKENITKFYVITHKDQKSPVQSERTLLFLSIFNRVGVLKDILSVIASQNINLNKIESRPSQEKAWDYYFFIEIQIRRDDLRLETMKSLLKLFCPEIKILGSV